MKHTGKSDADEYRKRIDALLIIAGLLNRNGIDWSLGASMMLKLRGIDVPVDDLDILVRTDDTKALENIMSVFSPKKEHGTPAYPTTHFFEFSIAGVDIDLMIGFKVNTSRGIHSFDETREVDTIDLEGTAIHLSSLEEWLGAYKAMKRDDKVRVIEDYLEKQ